MKNVKELLPFFLKKKMIFLWQFIKAIYESRKTTSFVKRINNNLTNKKIRIAFIVYFPEAWTSLQSIYEKLLKDNKVELLLLCQPNIKVNNSFPPPTSKK